MCFFLCLVLISVMSVVSSDVGRGHGLTDLDVDGADADAAATGLHRACVVCAVLYALVCLCVCLSVSVCVFFSVCVCGGCY